MGKISGQKEYQAFQVGKPLSPKQAIKAQCYVCNGEGEGSNVDCKGKSCPLYPFFRKWTLKGRKSIVEPESGTLLSNKSERIGV